MAGALHGKVALVTGAGSGIGRATALALAHEGADVLVHYSRSQEAAESVVKTIQDEGRRAHAIQAYFNDRESVGRLAEAAEQQWGHVDILVNNAGRAERGIDPVTQGGDFGHHMSWWDKVFDVNLRAPYELTWRLAQGMRERGQGVVVNIASIAGLYALNDVPIYSLSKAALLHFTRQAARMYAPHVRVNAIAPGWVETDFEGGYIRDPEFQKQVRRGIPMDRLGQPEEVAQMVLYLCKDATYTTGTTLVADGGMVSELR